jgi:hypothetical protein
MEKVGQEFKRWDRCGALKLKASVYGRDVLEEFQAKLSVTGLYRCWWLEEEVQMQYSDGSTKTKSKPYLHIETR